jgi:hypothetical protein
MELKSLKTAKYTALHAKAVPTILTSLPEFIQLLEDRLAKLRIQEIFDFSMDITVKIEELEEDIAELKLKVKV